MKINKCFSLLLTIGVALWNINPALGKSNKPSDINNFVGKYQQEFYSEFELNRNKRFIASSLSSPYCDCDLDLPEDYYEYANFVFAGTVTDIDTINKHKIVTFKISQVWKQEQKSKVILSSEYSTCFPNFIRKKTYLVYAMTDGNNNFTTHACFGSKNIDEADNDLMFLEQQRYLELEEERIRGS